MYYDTVVHKMVHKFVAVMWCPQCIINSITVIKDF